MSGAPQNLFLGGSVGLPDLLTALNNLTRVVSQIAQQQAKEGGPNAVYIGGYVLSVNGSGNLIATAPDGHQTTLATP